ncbi:Conserved hypothetical protein [Clostridium neonatale]|uniref:hypothetical protein n=1 Tax=Clostridium neonatale TaxID=137838 RepID=UPI00291B58DC|nr:Conserved hypothetical protein [Clostridium neonatale]
MTLKESLVFSYLKHIKKCKIIQTNWVPKTKDWDEEYDKAKELIRISKNYFKNKYRINIFKNISLDDDIIKLYNNIDAFGITFNKDYTQDIYGVMCELNESYNEVNIENVLEKIFIISTYLVSYFNRINGNIIIMCSKLNDKNIREIGTYYFDIKEIFRQVNLSFEVSILINEKFQEEVISKLEKVCLDIDETEEEIYLKSLKLQKQLNYKNNDIEENNEYVEKKIKSDAEEETSSTIEIEAVKPLEENDYGNIDHNVKETNKNKISKLDITIDEDINGILFDNISNIDDNRESHTTKYYMNNRNVKTQLRVDDDSISKIIEERNRKLVENLLKNKKYEGGEIKDKYDDIKIGELVKKEFDRLFRDESVPKGEIRKLQEYDYCKEIFGIDYPVLKEVDMEYSLEEQRRDENGNAIYYGFIATIYDKDYYICSVWSEENRRDFLRWMSFLR